MGGQGRDLIFSIFWLVSECLEDLPVSILVQKPLKELYSCEPARPEEQMKDVGELGMRLQSRESHIQGLDVELGNQAQMWGWSVG